MSDFDGFWEEADIFDCNMVNAERCYDAGYKANSEAIQAILAKLTMNQPSMVQVGKYYTLKALQDDLKAIIGEGK